MKKMLVMAIFFIAMGGLFSSASQTLAQNSEPTPTPSPAPPPTIYFDYTVVEQSCDGCENKDRQILVEIELGKKLAGSKKLATLLQEGGFPVIKIEHLGVRLAYPADTTDCYILADATRIAYIALKFFPKNYEPKFNMGFLRDNFYNILPPCGATRPRAIPSPTAIAHFLFVRLVGLIKSPILAIILKLYILWRYRLMVRTDGFHPSNRGSIPRSATKLKKHLFAGVFCLSQQASIIAQIYLT